MKRFLNLTLGTLIAIVAVAPAHAGITISGQPPSSKLTDIAALAVTDSNVIVGNGTTWVAESGATARTSLGLGSVENTALSTWAGSANLTTVGTLADSLAISKSSGDVTGTATRTSPAGGYLVGWVATDGTVTAKLAIDNALSLSPYVGTTSNHSFYLATNNVARVKVSSTGLEATGSIAATGAVSGTGTWDVSTAAANDGRINIYAPDNATTALFLRINATQANVTGADTYATFESTSGIEGSVQGTATPGLIAYNTFTGSHWATGDKILAKKVKRKVGKGEEYQNAMEPGTVLVSTDAISRINGKTHLPKVAVSTKKNDKAVYGVYGGHDQRGNIQVLAVGSGIVLVTDEGGLIEPGDMLCTSSTPGYATKCSKPLDIEVIGFKARQSLKKGAKRGKIACTYWAG